MGSFRPDLTEVIVVEGVHDAQAVQEAVQADIWVIGGDRIAKRFLSELERAAAVRGVIVLTDPDGPGERIRERIRRAVPEARHAFIPKHMASGRRQGKDKIGVEHSSPSVIQAALEDARGGCADAAQRGFDTAQRVVQTPAFTTGDLLGAGLLGGSEAVRRRQQLGDLLGIGSGNGKSFLKKLNALRVTREEWQDALYQLEQQKESSRS